MPRVFEYKRLSLSQFVNNTKMTTHRIVRCFLICVLFYAPTQAAVPLGVNPEEAGRYIDTTTFQCSSFLGGQIKIPFSAVNDNYCDCSDGSDEPGTSACAGMSRRQTNFFCQNAGFISRTISLSRAGDDICDCCDGSDETVGKCESTCDAKAKLLAEQSRAQREIHEKGFALRQKFLPVVSDGLEKINADISTTQKRLDDAVNAKKLLELKKDLLEEQKIAEQSILRQNAILESSARIGLHRLSQEKLLSLVLRMVREQEVSFVERVVALAKEMADINCNDTTIGCDSLPSLEEEEASSEVTSVSDENLSDEEEDEINLEDTNAVEELSSETITAKYIQKHIQGLFSNVDNFDLPDAIQIRSEVSTHENTVNELQKTVDNLREVASKDYGSDNIWYALHDTCLSTDLRGYKWTLCPLKDLKQDSVKVGKFEKWNENYTKMFFNNGDRCWNGPQRSAEIALVCGVEDKLISMDEPSKCVYQGVFSTPLMCTN